MKSSGIYAITNTRNGSQYIGSSKDIAKRWRLHLVELRLGLHSNPRLQASWDIFGENVFKLEILETVPPDTLCLLEREQHFIDLLAPVFNIYHKAGRRAGFTFSRTTRARMSRTRKSHPSTKDA